MLRCVEQLLPSIFEKEDGKAKKKAIFPEDDLDTLANNPERYREIRDAVNKQLGITRTAQQ
jgi:malate dehydrogenase (quinone)